MGIWADQSHTEEVQGEEGRPGSTCGPGQEGEFQGQGGDLREGGVRRPAGCLRRVRLQVDIRERNACKPGLLLALGIRDNSTIMTDLCHDLGEFHTRHSA